MKAIEKYLQKKINLALPVKTFRDEHSFEKRLNESTRIREKYPDRVPIICEKWGNDPDVPQIDRKKYLVPNDLCISQFVYIIRQRLKLSSEKSIYLFINDTIMPHTAGLISSYYHKYKDEDGFLYISYSGENTFG